MEGDIVTLSDIFVFDYKGGVEQDGRLTGELHATGIRPKFEDATARPRDHAPGPHVRRAIPRVATRPSDRRSTASIGAARPAPPAGVAALAGIVGWCRAGTGVRRYGRPLGLPLGSRKRPRSQRTGGRVAGARTLARLELLDVRRRRWSPNVLPAKQLRSSRRRPG